MIKYLTHKEIDKAKWDACIDGASYSILYGYSWYLDIISPGWDALIDDDYESVFPLTWKKKFGLRYLTQPHFAQQLGVFGKKMESMQEINSFLNAIPKKFFHYDLYMNPLNGCPDRPEYYTRLRKTYHVQLNSSYSRVYEKYSGDTKRNLKKAPAKNLILRTLDVEDVIELYKKNVWFKTPDLTLKDYEVLHKLAKEVAARKQCLSIGAFENGILSAGTLFFINGDKIIFIFGSTDKTGRKNGAMRFIFDHVIKNNCNKNLVLDFEGSSVDTVEYFYKSFGSDRITFYNIRYSKTNALRKVIEAKQKITRLIAVSNIKKHFIRETSIENGTLKKKAIPMNEPTEFR